MISETPKIKLAIFASGGGSNALKILEYFEQHTAIEISLILYNNKSAGVIQHGLTFNVPTVYWNKTKMNDAKATLSMLNYYHVNGILLAGFLALIPEYLVQRFSGKILNIHPALLPDFGGHGMYGHFVHEAVSASGNLCSGITIHLIDAEYDKGKILFQYPVSINANEDPVSIQKKVLALEHLYYAPIIEKYFMNPESLF